MIASVDAQYTVNTLESTTYGINGALTYSGAPNPNAYASVNFDAVFLDQNIVRLKFNPINIASGQRTPYVVPNEVFPGNENDPSDTVAAVNPNYRINSQSNVISVSTADGARTLLSFESLRIDELHLSFTTAVSPTAFISGYGEHNFRYFLNPTASDNGPTTLSLWNTDNGGIPWEKPLYGVHPVMFVADPRQPLFYAFVWVNSNAQRLTIDGSALTFEAAGGIINVYLITGTTMLDVISRYHRLIGPSLVPPYWSLGTHQCRWGYRNISELQAVVAGYKSAMLPLETMWNDIDYMDQFRVFTTDPERYPTDQLRAFVDTLHANNQHYVQIIDPGVAAAVNYSTFSTGVEQNAFVKINGQDLINVVWPGWTAFPDFTSQAGYEFWKEQLNAYLDKIPLDGVWLDMNELGTFCGGHCPVAPGTAWKQDWHTVDWNNFDQNICIDQGNCTIANSVLNNPPFNPLTNGWFLYNRTLDMNADLAMGKYYDTKTFYGMMECDATHRALVNRTGKRPFILSRASFLGSGRVTAHWTGDNYASWTLESGGIQDSIQAVLASNLWGVTTVGADIGGFGGTTTEELLTRWTQLGAYYSFMRNHHGLGGPGQEPYLFGEDAKDAMRDAMQARYQLLPYLFTGLLRAHYLGGPFLRHLSVEFPQDIATYAESFQFMFGESILVTPVVIQGVSQVTGYVPSGAQWYHLWSGKPVDGGRQHTFPCPLYAPLPVLVRGGSVVPIHTSAHLTVKATRATGIGLICALSADGGAASELWLDDGQDGILPPTIAPLARVGIACSGSGGQGFVRTRRLDGPGAAFSPTQLPAMLPEGPNVTIYFPEPHGYTATELALTLNGAAFTPEYLFADGNVLTFLLPRDIDATVVFDVSWVLGGGSPTAAPGGSGTPAPGGSDDTHSAAYRGMVVVTAVLAASLAASLVALVYFRRRLAEETSLLGNMH